MKAADFNKIFQESITDYYSAEGLYPETEIPYEKGTIEYLLFSKNRIDNIQWNLEDIIREEGIDPIKALEAKREIDKRNQQRTDTVEFIDDYFYEKYQDVQLVENYRTNTETPAWAIDRMSILSLKVYHMSKEAMREGAKPTVQEKCLAKLSTLRQQNEFLVHAIDELLSELASGKCKVNTFKQMKMYNDPELNPFLRKDNE